MFTGLIASSATRVALGDSADGWILQDEAGHVLAIESEGNTLLGWNRSDILGLSGAKIVHPHDRPLLRSAQQEALHTTDAAPIHLRFRTPTGTWLRVECRFTAVTAVTDNDGLDGRRTILTLRDTSANHPERSVMALAGELRGSFVSAPTLAQAWTDCLDRLARRTGSSAAVVWERNRADSTVGHALAVDPDGDAIVAARRGSSCSDTSAALVHAWTTGLAATVPVDDVCPTPIGHHLDPDAVSVLIPLQSDASTHCVVELIRPTGDIGQREVAMAALLKIAETVHRRELDRKLSAGELSFRLVFDEAAIGMCIIAVDGTFIAANAALCDLLGYSAGELVGRPYRHFTFDEDDADNETVMNNMLSGELSASQREVRFIHADGSEVWASIAVSLVRRDGEPRRRQGIPRPTRQCRTTHRSHQRPVHRAGRGRAGALLVPQPAARTALRLLRPRRRHARDTADRRHEPRCQGIRGRPGRSQGQRRARAQRVHWCRRGTP